MMKKHLFAIVYPAERDGFYYKIQNSDRMKDVDSWIYLGEVDLPDPDLDEIARVGLGMCDEAETEAKAALQEKIAILQEARAVYRSLPAPDPGPRAA